MEEGLFWFIMFGLIILGFFIFMILLIVFGDYIKCKRCGRWHDMYNIKCIEVKS